jgi:hypothetical protein
MIATVITTKTTQESAGVSSTQLILPVIAIVISVCAAVLPFMQWYLEGRRITVDARSTFLVQPSERSRSCIMLSVTNTGRIPAIIRQWGFDNPREVYLARPGTGIWSMGPEMPFTLEPGATQAWWLDYREQKRLLETGHPGPGHVLRGFVRLGTGKPRTSRSFIRLGTGVTVPMNPLKRRLNSITRAAGPAVLIFSRMGADYFAMSLLRPKFGLYFTRFSIDVVVEERGSTPAHVLPDYAFKFRFWMSRKKEIRIPDHLLDVPGARYRIRWQWRRHPREQRNGIPSRAELARLQETTLPPSS